MEGREIARQSSAVALTIAITTAISGAFDMSGYSGGMVLVPSAWTDANIGFKVSETSGGTFTILKDDTGTPVQISSVTTDASYWYSLPAEVFASKWVKLWSKSTTAATVTDTAQGAARSLTVLLKG